MGKPFDVVTKHLIEARPGDWLAYLGIHSQAPVDVIDADLATVTTQADRVLRIREVKPWLVHLELQASYDALLMQRLLRYNVLLQGRHGLPVLSAAVLLRPKADGPEMTGRVQCQLPDGWSYLDFHCWSASGSTWSKQSWPEDWERCRSRPCPRRSRKHCRPWSGKCRSESKRKRAHSYRQSYGRPREF